MEEGCCSSLLPGLGSGFSHHFPPINHPLSHHVHSWVSAYAAHLLLPGLPPVAFQEAQKALIGPSKNALKSVN